MNAQIDSHYYLQLRRAFAMLKEGLGPYLLHSYREMYDTKWSNELSDATRSFKSIDFANDDAILSSLDTQGHLDLILNRRDAFSKRLGRLGLAYAVELRVARDRMAHDNNEFSSEEVARVFATVSLMLGLIGAPDLAADATALSTKIQTNFDHGNPGSAHFAMELRAQMAAISRTIEALTSDQYRIIEWTRSVKRASISGCAGSGKTLVALEKAIRLEKAGLQVLILCHNPFLAEHLRRLTSRTTILAHDFAEWVAQLVGDQRETTGSTDWIHYEEPTEADIATAVFRLRNSKIRYDAVVVDEGQDFRESWWKLIDCTFEEPERAILYVFHDDNQALLPLRSTYPVQEAPFSMSKNCRNAGAVFNLVRRLHPQAPDPSILLADQGIAKKTVFSGNGGLAAVSRAVADALSFLDPDRLIVLSTEPVTPKASVLSGLTVTVANRWKWQDAVERSLRPALRRYGYGRGPLGQPEPIALPQMSSEPWPTEHDIATITALARKVRDRVRAIGLLVPDARGRYWSTEDENGLYLMGHPLPPDVVLGIFASDHWADSLPRPRQFVLGQPADGKIRIRIRTTSTFKGLEADGVVLFLRRAQHNFDANVYVAVSRARLYLNVVTEATTLAHVPCLFGLPNG